MITFSNSDNHYRFGDGVQVGAIKNAIIPVTIGRTATRINVDIVPNNIPLLLSRNSMKKANMTLNFEEDTIIAFGESVNLIVTKTGHYAVPITNNKRILNDVTNKNDTPNNVTLTLINEKTPRDIAIKLHRQFAHPTSQKLIKLLKSAGDQWKNNQELKDEINKVSIDCKCLSSLQKASQ